MLKRLVYIYFLIAPFIYYVRIATSNSALFIMDAILMLIVLGIGMGHGGRLPKRFNLILSIWVVYVACAGIQVFNLNLPSIGDGLTGFRGHILATVFIFVPCFVFRSTDDLRRFILILAGTAVVVAFVGLKQVVVGYNEIETAWITIRPQLWSRTFSTMGSAHLYATFMAMVAVICLCSLRLWDKKLKIMLALIALLCVVALITSHMRSPLLALPVGLFVALVLVGRRFSVVALVSKTAFFLVLAGGILLVIFHIMAGQNELDETSPLRRNLIEGIQRIVLLADEQQADASFQQRLDDIYNTIDYSWAHPFGAGPGAFAGVDNYFVVVAGEMGWLGLFLLMVLLSAIAFACMSALRMTSDPDLFRIGRALSGACAVVFFVCLSTPILYTPIFASYFWFMAGILLYLPQIDQAAKSARIFPRKVS